MRLCRPLPAALPRAVSSAAVPASVCAGPDGAAGRAGHSGCSRPDRADGAAGCTGSSRRPRCAGRHWAYRTSRSDGCHRRRRPAGTAGHSRRSRSRRRGWRNGASFLCTTLVPFEGRSPCLLHCSFLLHRGKRTMFTFNVIKYTLKLIREIEVNCYFAILMNPNRLYKFDQDSPINALNISVLQK